MVASLSAIVFNERFGWGGMWSVEPALRKTKIGLALARVHHDRMNSQVRQCARTLCEPVLWGRLPPLPPLPVSHVPVVLLNY
jgi:hypothetical protein